VPEITAIGAFTDCSGRVALPLFRNDLLVKGASQLRCYEPLLGYRLEWFPKRQLHPGPILPTTPQPGTTLLRD